MGYTTEFKGTVKSDKPIERELAEYINRFADARHVKYDVQKIKEHIPNYKEFCYNGNPGKDGMFFVGYPNHSFKEYIEKGIIVDNNQHPSGVPELWCQWIVTGSKKDENGDTIYDTIKWNGAEKFYSYVEWMEFLIKHFLAPNGYVLNGKIRFQGEEMDDGGTIIVEDNDVMQEYNMW